MLLRIPFLFPSHELCIEETNSRNRFIFLIRAILLCGLQLFKLCFLSYPFFQLILVTLQMTNMRIGIAADHGGFELKQIIQPFLLSLNYEVIDFGAYEQNNLDDYPDFVIPLSKAVAAKEVERGIAICGSGVGAAIVANKIRGVRASLITDHFSAHQGVEDDDMNLLCLGGRITGFAVAKELVKVFLESKFSGGEKYVRRLNKIIDLEK
jgi:ribose 5-phosphate isomerase B